MGLIHFLRRRLGTPGAPPAPALPPPGLAKLFPTPVVRHLTPPVARRAVVMRADRPPAGQDLLQFAVRRDTRLAATVPDARGEILRLHQMIEQLHRQRRRLEGERDRWERLARELEAELAALRRTELRGTIGASGGTLGSADKFRRAKTLLARLTHPDSSGATGVEAAIRARLFQEFWAEFERIEAE